VTTLTTLTATLAWLTDPLDPGGDSVQCGTRRPQPLTDTTDGELVLFAGGRAEMAVYDAEQVNMPVVFAALTGAQLAQVKAWKGRTLLLRTIDGARLYGAYLAVAQTTYLLASPVVYDAEVMFQAVSYSDTV
jgi:hypothetical protein